MMLSRHRPFCWKFGPLVTKFPKPLEGATACAALETRVLWTTVNACGKLCMFVILQYPAVSDDPLGVVEVGHA